MNPIDEHDFKLACKTRAIKQVRLQETEDGYLLQVTVSWKEGVLTLHTQKKRPRKWANLNRLIEFLRRQELGLDSITISLYHE